MLEIALRPGCNSYYEPSSNVYLTLSNPRAYVASNDLSGLRAAYLRQGNACPFVIVSGQFPEEKVEVVVETLAIEAPVVTDAIQVESVSEPAPVVELPTEQAPPAPAPKPKSKKKK